MANKKTQHDSLNVEQALSTSEAFIDKYKKTIVAAIVAVVVIIAGVLLYKNLVAGPREAKANELIFKGQEYFAADNYEKALNGDGQGYPGFVEIADEYGSTKAGNLAQLYAGLSYFKLDKFEEAAERLQKFSDCDDEMVSPAALGALGHCYAELDQTEKAAATLVKAARKADNNTLSPIFLIQAGELYEAQKQNDKALECYQEVKTKYVNSLQYTEIEKYIERVSE